MSDEGVQPMPAPHNVVKSALAEAKVQIGLWLALGNPTTAAIAAGAGYDWCLIDGDHGRTAVLNVLEQVRAIDGQGAAPVVRISADAQGLMQDVLDLGVQTLLVSGVETEADVNAVVQATRYPPTGTRTLSELTMRASNYGAIEDYAATANDQICVLIQVSGRTGLENVSALAEVAGVDGVFLSASDLCASLGHLGQPECPEMVGVIEDAIDKIKLAGKAPGIVTFKSDALKRYADRGVTFLGVGGDATTYAKAVRDLATSAAAVVQRGAEVVQLHDPNRTKTNRSN
ncbi:MAG: aldolase/citrate lyase family protein [Pseudomonadota bacterium]